MMLGGGMVPGFARVYLFGRGQTCREYARYIKGPRCQCCDLPAYSCGTRSLERLRAQDPEYASFVERGGMSE
jgi:hypothetical protein